MSDKNDNKLNEEQIRIVSATTLSSSNIIKADERNNSESP